MHIIFYSMIARSNASADLIARLKKIVPNQPRFYTACRWKHFSEIWNSITCSCVHTWLNVSSMHAGRYRCGYDRNGAYLWDSRAPKSRHRVRTNEQARRFTPLRDQVINISYPFDDGVASSRRCRSGSGVLQHLRMPRQMHIRRVLSHDDA